MSDKLRPYDAVRKHLKERPLPRIDVTHVAAELQQDCCDPDPDVAREAMRLIEEGRNWLADCQWVNMDEEDFDTLGTRQIVAGVERYYDGGWKAFLKA